jgi:hypothetical protein
VKSSKALVISTAVFVALAVPATLSFKSNLSSNANGLTQLHDKPTLPKVAEIEISEPAIRLSYTLPTGSFGLSSFGLPSMASDRHSSDDSLKDNFRGDTYTDFNGNLSTAGEFTAFSAAAIHNIHYTYSNSDHSKRSRMLASSDVGDNPIRLVQNVGTPTAARPGRIDNDELSLQGSDSPVDTLENTFPSSGSNNVNIGGIPGSMPPKSVPEIDAGQAGIAFGLLAAMIACLRERRKIRLG